MPVASIASIQKEVEAVRITTFDRNPVTKKYEDMLVGPTVFINDRGLLCVSAEDGTGFADYWEGMWIDPSLEEIAKKHNAYWDWENPGVISLSF